MLAIPYFARQNRLAETGRLRRPQTVGHPVIDSGGAGETTNAAASVGPGQGSRLRRNGPGSMVWIKAE